MGSPIQIVLQEDVEHLGVSGDVVRARAGYARNYLIPRGLAVPATPANLARVDDLRRLAQVRAQKALEEARATAKKLEAVSVKLERAVGTENKMYGSVTAKDIVEAYAAMGLEVDRRKVELAEPIKKLGLSEVVVRIHPEVKAQLRVEVIKASS